MRVQSTVDNMHTAFLYECGQTQRPFTVGPWGFLRLNVFPQLNILSPHLQGRDVFIPGSCALLRRETQGGVLSARGNTRGRGW